MTPGMTMTRVRFYLDLLVYQRLLGNKGSVNWYLRDMMNSKKIRSKRRYKWDRKDVM